MPRCAIYARYSSDRQSETSAEDQARVCRARAEREGWDVVEVYSDLAISGASNRRPGLNALLADAAAGAFDIVLSEALDRVARDQADIATIYQKLCFANVQLVTLSEGAINELHIGLKGTMGALFLKELADKVRRGQRGNMARGRLPGGLCYGYAVVRTLDERGEIDAGRRAIVPEQAAVVRRILEEYVAGKSPKAIARDLNRDGIPSARGGEWRVSAIVGNRARMIGILHNPIYVGRFAWNRVHMRRDPETRNRVSRPNAAEQIEFVDMPELRIVSDELWQAAQDRRLAQSAEPLSHRRRPRHLLSGLVRCGVCGGSFVRVSDTRLGCARHKDAGTCDNRRRVQAAELQRRALAGLEHQLLAPEAVALLVEEYERERRRRDGSAAAARRQLAARLAKSEAAVSRLVTVLAEGGADFADVRAALAQHSAERDRLRAAVAEADAVPTIARQPTIAAAYRERVLRLVAGLSPDAEPGDATIEQLRELIDVIYVHPTDEGVELEVVGSLAAALSIATPTRQGGAKATTKVADLRYHRAE